VMTYRWHPVESHDMAITVGISVGAKSWYWICKTHHFGCNRHMIPFMEQVIHTDRQERLL
jgi:hypothetical protein